MADLTGIGAIFDFGGKIIDKVWPDKTEAEKAKLKLFELQMNGELQQLAADLELAKGQLQVNAVEAQSSSVFVAGWRPAVGWVCVMGLLYTFIIRPLLAWASGFAVDPVPVVTPEVRMKGFEPIAKVLVPVAVPPDANE